MTSEPMAPSEAASAGARRSSSVTTAGVLLILVCLLGGALPLILLVPGLLLAGGSFSVAEMLGFVGLVVIYAACGIAGLAIIRRWPGWRYYAGTFGWIFLVFGAAAALVNLLKGAQSGMEHFEYFSTIVGGLLFVLGLFILLAKRRELPDDRLNAARLMNVPVRPRDQ
jgi:hypothetical protein